MRRKRKSVGLPIAIMVLAAMAASGHGDWPGAYRDEQQKKPKYPFTDDEVEQMAGMTPKEKKAFLKQLKLKYSCAKIAG